MSETAKTGVFGVIALVAVVVSLVTRPAAPGRADPDDSGERFFEAFDPLEATSLEIVGNDEDEAGVAGFKVAQIDGVWSIPSHDNYPADATDQLASAAADVADLVKGTKVSDNPADHALYGVVDPVGVAAGATGVGTRVTLRDAGNAVLADLIVGKSVKDAPNLRYARVPDRDRVYSSKVTTDHLTTTFEEWIEDDLLQLDPMDVRQVIINDYSVDELSQRLVEGEVVRLDYSDDLAQWTMANLGEGESLNKAKVNSITRALDDLRIVDVFRKPAGLSAELRAAENMRLDGAAVQSLRQRGFYISGGRLLSNEGETILNLKNGVAYVLRFGEIAIPRRTAGGLDEEAEEPATPPEEGASRYLFVMASFDPTLIPEPAYEPVPEETEDGDDAERTRILAANEQKLDDWEQEVVDGEQLVEDLNARFADWYYVIPDSVYQDIRLTREDLVEAVETPDEVETTDEAEMIDEAETDGEPEGG